MSQRLGDIIDDYCTRCGRLTDHSVVAMVGNDVKKVRCRTCNHDHDFRHGKGSEKKKKTKLSAYEEVLASITAGRPGEAGLKPPAPKPSRPSHRSRLRPTKTRPLPKH